MLEKAKQFLQISIGSTIGVYLGHSFWQWRDYQAHPDLYAMASAPWYTSLLTGAAFTALLVAIEAGALYIVSRKLAKRRANETKGDRGS